MEQSFWMAGAASNAIMCMIDGADIYQTDYMGNKKLIGKTCAAYTELEETTTEYYNKLVELGVITPQKPPEQLMAEMQATMLDMSKIIAGLSAEVKELKNGSPKCDCAGGADVSERKHKCSGKTGTASDQRNA